MNQKTNKIPLAPLHTFGIQAFADRLLTISSKELLQEFIKQGLSTPYYILGGGSNIVFTKDFVGTILQVDIKGKEVVKETTNEVIVKVGAGESWHNFVLWCLEKDFGGVENLSLIPGTVGAAPIQNIGAYGVELVDIFDQLEAIDLATAEERVFQKEECQFAYRDSIFKQSLKGKILITHVYLRLSKQAHQIHSSYGAIQDTLKDWQIDKPSIQEISKAVIHIRQSKLPDPKVIGNAGSFFKNPVIDRAQFERLKDAFPDIVGYPLDKNKVKVPAAWLIDQCGWKGKKMGNVGCYEKQALVMVNYGNAQGHEVKAHADRVIDSVKEKFGVSLNPEVNLV
ncbi:MAG: UDP-N-acetylmuramate dehydrogenase [Saprospiraceae bacterium]|nr:UDP-N-acetylmuramate dehydrogenase [Saprospiraceae bacterium]